MRAGRCGTAKTSQKQTKAHIYKVQNKWKRSLQNRNTRRLAPQERQSKDDTVRLVVSTLSEHMGQKHTSFKGKEHETPFAPYEHQNRSKHTLFILNLTQYTISGKFQCSKIRANTTPLNPPILQLTTKLYTVMNWTGLPEHNSVNIPIRKQRLPHYTIPQLTTAQHTTIAALPSILLRWLLEIHVSSFRMMKTCCGELVCLLFGVNAAIFEAKAGEAAVSFRVRCSLNFTKRTANPTF